MALEFAYALNSELTGVIKDFDVATAGDAKKGDLVRLNATTGKVEQAAAAGVKGFGVVEGTEFLGLGQGGTYAATAASATASASATTIKVRVDGTSVYRIPFTGTPVIGGSYDIAVASGDQTLNAAATTNPQLKVVDIKGSVAYVTIINALA